MTNQLPRKTLFDKLLGYYAVPHELLHVLAYRIIGKPCRYQIGDYSVWPLAPRTRRERLFIALLPFVVFFGLGLLSLFLWVLSAFFIHIPPERYFIDGPTWHIVFLITGAALIFYSGAAHGDLVNSYHLLFGEDETQDDRPEPHRSPDEQQQQRQYPNISRNSVTAQPTSCHFDWNEVEGEISWSRGSLPRFTGALMTFNQ